MRHVCGFICYLCVELKLMINTRSLSNQALQSVHLSLLSSRCWPWGVFIGAGQPLQHSEVRKSYLVWVRPVGKTFKPFLTHAQPPILRIWQEAHGPITVLLPWWRHQMETFSALLAICAENSPVPGEFPTQRPVTRSFDVYFDLRPNKRLSKQSWGWWFETQSRPLWRHRNAWQQSYPINGR